MVPRTSIVALPEEASVIEAARVATQHRLSRFPVYRGDLDHIIGVVHSKDLPPPSREGRAAAPATLGTRELLRVPETKLGREVLQELRAGKKPLAIVLDEYG